MRRADEHLNAGTRLFFFSFFFFFFNFKIVGTTRHASFSLSILSCRNDFQARPDDERCSPKVSKFLRDSRTINSTATGRKRLCRKFNSSSLVGKIQVAPRKGKIDFNLAFRSLFVRERMIASARLTFPVCRGCSFAYLLSPDCSRIMYSSLEENGRDVAPE